MNYQTAFVLLKNTFFIKNSKKAKDEEMKSSDREPKMYNSQSQPSNILVYAFTSL